MIQHDASPLISGIYCSGPLLDFALTCARSYGYVILRLGSLLKTPVATPLGLYKYLAKQALMGYSASQPFFVSSRNAPPIAWLGDTRETHFALLP